MKMYKPMDASEERDWCASSNSDNRGVYGPSQHRYRYSMGVWKEWRVQIFGYAKPPGETRMRGIWTGGTAYNYGIGAPRYPVPAVRGWNYLSPPNDGGVKNDCVMIGATYVDWSRGSIEIL